jgi:L-lactate dehydrogenase complex protein LldE
VALLEKFQVPFEYPEEQTCCGQPLANTGLADETRPLARRFEEIFRPYDYVVCPSGSCAAMVKHHYAEHFDDHEAADKLAHKTFELCEFLVRVLELDRIEAEFPHRVGLHQSCHGLRELRLGSSSEVVGPNFNLVRGLLEGVKGLKFVDLERPDECCGFGGTFAVAEEAVSCMMGRDRIADHEQAGAEVIAAVDMSCLMHLDGLIRRDGKPLRVAHVAEILAETWSEPA